ncbi:hypothetical protein HN843_07530 [bacterium]|nr:hypothetical protein [bacterium]
MCLLLFAVPVIAVDDLGLYFDSSATISEFNTTSMYEEVELYLILTNPSEETGVSGWEAEIKVAGDPLAQSWALSGGMNLAVAPKFIVGVGIGELALPVVDNAILLATCSVFIESPGDEVEFWLHAIGNPSMLDPPIWGNPIWQPVYTKGNDSQQMVAMNWSSGCEDTPIAIINSDGIIPEGELFFNPLYLNFGALHPGQGAERSVVIQNESELELTGNLSFDGDDFTWRVPSGPFVESGDVHVLPGSQTELIIRFEPHELGNYDSALILETCGNISQLNIVADSEQYLLLLHPGDGDIFDLGSIERIRWIGEILDDEVKVELNRNTGSGWETLASNLPNTGYFDWLVSGNASGTCVIRVSSMDGTVSDTSDGAFEISGQWVNVTNPAGGEFLVLGDELDITWDYRSISLFNIDITRDNGATWESIAVNVPGGSYNWTVSGNGSSACIIRVSSSDNVVFANSGVFSICYPSLTLEEPTSESIWYVGCPGTVAMSGTCVDGATVTLSRDNGINWETIGQAQINPDFSWTATGPASDLCIIRISNGTLVDQSDIFSIQPLPTPESCSASIDLETGIQLNWEWYSEISVGFYMIYRDGSFCSIITNPDVTEYFDGSCTNGEHTYEIRSYSGCGSYGSCVVTGERVANPLGEISWCSATDDLTDSVVVDWVYSGSGNIGIRIYRDDALVYQGEDPDQTSWVDYNCTPDQLYAYVIAAWDIERESQSCTSTGVMSSNAIHIDFPSPYSMIAFGYELDILWHTAQNHNIDFVDIQLSRTGANGQWELLFSAVPNDGQEPWWVTPPISYDCYLKISNSENPDQYAISGPFTIDNSPVGIELDPVIEPEAVPANFALSGCAPNPFNPITTISYDVPESRGMVNIGIYDISGKMVKQLVHQYKAAGNYSVDWRGKDRSGRSMPTGVYFCRMTAPGYSRSIKLTLVQ